MILRRIFQLSAVALLGLTACQSGAEQPPAEEEPATIPPTEVIVEAESFFEKSEGVTIASFTETDKGVTAGAPDVWAGYEIRVPVAGRYQCEVRVRTGEGGSVWLEDYYDNEDGRTYNITGSMQGARSESFQILLKDGSPLDTGLHKIKLHLSEAGTSVDWIRFTLIRNHEVTPVVLTQNTEGEEWVPAWSDEFDGEGLPDTAKWTFDVGDWGWGNNEAQYYTAFRTENARQEDGNLIIEARKNDMGQAWTSARLTTRGKVSFLYGKIEFRAKAPAGDGAWSAGWTLGDAYRDEISWPYCGEIDILECTGHEIDDQTGKGINHISCHTRAYYFKQNNHITSTQVIDDMVNEFHTYAVEWMPDEVRGYVDGEHVYTYDKTESEWAWPYNKPQNLIINIAMGGGMGGEIDPAYDKHQLILDYVRVYQKQ